MDRSSIQEAICSAFAASLTSGTFVDTAYYAFSSRCRDGIVTSPRVIYANSTVLKAAGDYFAAQLAGGFDTQQRVKQTSTDTYSYEDDSDLEDCEDDGGDHVDDLEEWVSSSSDPGSSKGKGKADPDTVEPIPSPSEPRTPAHVKHTVVLPDIAANTWHALIYYIYTGDLRFAPLKSQGHNYRTKAIVADHEQNPEKPILCSPKSMYRLADIVGLESVKNLAKQNITAKLSRELVIEEAFSHFSSTYPEVMDAQLRFLYSVNVMPAVVLQLQEKLRAVTEGRLPHAENVLNALVMKLSALLVGDAEPASSAQWESPSFTTPADDAPAEVPEAEARDLSSGTDDWWAPSPKLRNQKAGGSRR